VELDERDEHELRALIAVRKAWAPRSAVNGRLPRLLELDLVELWESDALGQPLEGGPYLSLMPHGADVMGVELVEHGDGSEPTWRPIPDLPPDARINRRRPLRLRPPWLSNHISFPETIPDPGPGPPELLDDEGAPVVLLGVPIRLDPRLAKSKRKKRKSK
jgi:hypothetical protein